MDIMSDAAHYDCLIIGAGISGIDAAYHLQEHCAWASYAILERRPNLGGTWDLFKYPGIRSDSDMYTFGFSWKVWKSPKPIAPAEDILAYLHEAVQEQGIAENIHFNTDIKTADWLSQDNRWYLRTAAGEKLSCNVLFGCTGYFSYENPNEPTFPGQETFPGTIVHPQKWTPEHDAMIIGKKVVMIGSGATAVTILPNIADVASHVTMIQRTPSYIAAIPQLNPWTQFFNDWLPTSVAVKVNWWKHVLIQILLFQYCTWFPHSAKKYVKGVMFKEVESAMSWEEFEKHFSPPYNPWEQRLCLAPDGDFFKPIREKKATMVTGHIDHFTKKGIQMKDGYHVDADFIISATGLTMQKNYPFSTIQVHVDGELYQASTHLIYNGIMIDEVPNFAFIVGYTNASWTLRADIASVYFTKLLNYMKSNKIEKVIPKEDAKDELKRKPFTLGGGGLISGYFARSAEILPKQGDKYPWICNSNYIIDLIRMYAGGLRKDSLEFTVANKKNK